MDIQVGDRVTYKYLDSNKQITMIVTLNSEINDLNKMQDKNYREPIKILKIERPNYSVIEEKKELLTEEEREFLEELIDNINQFSCARVNRIYIHKDEFYYRISFYQNLFYISNIKIDNKSELCKLERASYYTLSELRIGGKINENTNSNIINTRFLSSL